MRKSISILLCLMLLLSMTVPAFAETYETFVTYRGTGQEAYTLIVPATLAPGESGTIKLEGTWANNVAIQVDAPDRIYLTNSIDGGQKILEVDFVTFSQLGDNTKSISVSKTISVENISNALFGTWTGTINYNVTPITNGVTFTIDDVTYTVPDGSYWYDFTEIYTEFENTNSGSIGNVLNLAKNKFVVDTYNAVSTADLIKPGAYYSTGRVVSSEPT